MDSIEPQIISLIALFISILSLGWNVWNKIREDSRKLEVTAYFSRAANLEDRHACNITATNLGQKSITIRKIIVQEKSNSVIKEIFIFYKNYKDEIENRPIVSGEWRSIVVYDSNTSSFYDSERMKYKTIRLIILDSQKKKHLTNWFNQSTSNKVILP